MKYFTGFYKLLWLLLLLLGCSTGDSLSQRNAKDLTAVFYNVENLYDTFDDPRVNDNDFLPDSKKQWTPQRYRKKLEDLASVLSETGQRSLPVLIGLCEVENRSVVEDLASTGRLRRGRYEVVHSDSPDSRGIDVALLYQPSFIQITGHRVIPVVLPGRTRPTTRDILYTWGQIKNGEEVHIFVGHWPSRVGGVKQTEPNRVAVATIMRHVTDSLFKVNPDMKIIIMADANDTPDNYSLKEILGAVHPDNNTRPSLVNLMYPAHLRDEGSYNYRGSWDMLDNIIVSSAMLGKSGLVASEPQGNVFSREWMTYTNPQGQQAPNRTYVGDRYVGGVSDHFPVYFRMSILRND